MASVQAPRGLLINGASILSYDNVGTSPTATISLSLKNIVRIWRGEDILSGSHTGWEALPPTDRDQLTALYRRYSRQAFADISTLRDELVYTTDNERHTLDGTTWTAHRTRIALTDAHAHPENLVEAVKTLISEVETDVSVQFNAHLSEYELYKHAMREIPGVGNTSRRINEYDHELQQLIPSSVPAREREVLLSEFRRALVGDLPETHLDAVQASIRTYHGSSSSTRRDEISRFFDTSKEFAVRYRTHYEKCYTEYGDAITVKNAFDQWRENMAVTIRPSDEDEAKREFFAQTAYLVIVRMLLIRVFEDKNLVPRSFTDGGTALWFLDVEPTYFRQSLGRSMARLIEIAYDNAQQIYGHFYAEHKVFDWYSPDRNMVIRILHRLAQFDLSRIDRDIIGMVYGQYVNEQHKHQTGLYYTPPEVVHYILDELGYNGPDIVGSRLLDPASGSGAFLVEAGRRLVEAHRTYWKDVGYADIPADRIPEVIDDIRDSLFGLDVNPFACALAEMNLLIQVLDLLRTAYEHRQAVRIERFNVSASYTPFDQRFPGPC
ncbi:hypothetical protein CKO28_26640 [Rhodovibrio sodomensis]|uniref:site-specific DNA-methyltransferase (adenine-specific) n=2 Tax=Rhodovibrio sodomensis TaxID=1088 RepID=A0ABS1DN96_9PROT|nr:hypothetical protein [Rhodovibrio sodomensis]